MILSHPFRVTPDGSVAVVEEGSTRANAEAIAILAGTLRGERPIVPEFGVTDPAMVAIDPREVSIGLATFGPPGVTLTRSESEPVDQQTERVHLTFQEGS